jgi:hypothetical protein
MRRRARAALLIAGLVLLASCSSPGAGDEESSVGSPSPGASVDAEDRCDRITDELVGDVQAYVDGYGEVLGAKRRGPQAERVSDEELKAALTRTRTALEADECDMGRFDSRLREGLVGIKARGAVARAVLLQLTATMTGEAGAVPETVRVRPGEDLARVLARIAPGSTVRIAPGAHRLDESLAMLQGVTISGAGRGRSTITSTARDAGLLVLTDARVELVGVTLRHRGQAPASVLVGGPAASVVLTDVTIAGAVGGGDGGGSGVLMSARADEAGDRGTTLEVTGSRFERNDSAGILLSGAHRASIRNSEFRGNGQCGVCFTGSSGGAVRAGSFVDNAAGVALVDRARPLISQTTMLGGQVGIQASGRSAPVVRGVRVAGPERAAMLFSDRARGRVDDSTCRNVRYGIVVAGGALPFLGDNDCTVARSG